MSQEDYTPDYTVASSDEEIYGQSEEYENTTSFKASGASSNDSITDSTLLYQYQPQSLTDTLFDQDQVLYPHEPGSTGYPINWDLHSRHETAPFQDENVTSAAAAVDDEHYELVLLDNSSFEFEVIAHEFKSVNIDVYEIERVENKVQWERFRKEKEYMCSNRPIDFNVNECYLYHGTIAEKEQISEEGLDMRLSRLGHFGKGTYFSDNPLKCVQYSLQGGAPYIIKCRVLLGDVKIYPNGQMDTELKREPPKENAKGQWKYYDSVKGRPRDFNEFVIYENRRALVEYIITYKLTKEAKTYLEQQDALPTTKVSTAKPTQSKHPSGLTKRPSLEELNLVQLGQRRPSLEKLDPLEYIGQRRPSLEKLEQLHNTEGTLGQRRPSLEKLEQLHNTGGTLGQRRPSLEKLELVQVATGSLLQRRPSLEKLDAKEIVVSQRRRPSLEKLDQINLQRVPSIERSHSVEEIDQLNLMQSISNERRSSLGSLDNMRSQSLEDLEPTYSGNSSQNRQSSIPDITDTIPGYISVPSTTTAQSDSLDTSITRHTIDSESFTQRRGHSLEQFHTSRSGTADTTQSNTTTDDTLNEDDVASSSTANNEMLSSVHHIENILKKSSAKDSHRIQSLKQSFENTYKQGSLAGAVSTENQDTSEADIDPVDEVQEQMTRQFMAITSESNITTVRQYLERARWDLEYGISLYYDAF